MASYDRYKDGSFYCWMTGVKPEYRGKGVLKLMMDHLMKWAKKEGYKSIKIKTRNNRREMLAYLVKYGWNILEIDDRGSVEENRIISEKEI
ncbi:GNAT family N-acetyltransferase [Candidatus Woesearchaeota archaeon]|nr:GNAT family N-acetyltransferase [Candidatus Woesearchaeota archaeon]